MKDPRPSLLLLTMDCLRYDALGINGEPSAITPVIDSMAREGVVFDRHYSPYPLCMPARASMITGRYPNAHRVWANGVALPKHEVSLVDVLRQNGYQTACFGKGHFEPYRDSLTEPYRLQGQPPPTSSGSWKKENADRSAVYKGFETFLFADHTPYSDYHQWLTAQKNTIDGENKALEDMALKDRKLSWISHMPAELSKTDWITQQTIRYFNEQADRTRPFFCHVSFVDPHQPFNPPQPFASMLENATVRKPAGFDEGIPSTPSHYRKWFDYIYTNFCDKNEVLETWPDIIRRYWAKVTHVDDRIGRLLEWMKRHNRLDNTLVVLTSDHGTLLCDHQMIACGPHFYEGNIHIPLIVHAPQRVAKNMRSDALVSLVDLLPTFFDFADIPLPDGVQGLSYQPVLTQNAYQKRRVLLTEGRLGQSLEGYKGIISEDGWKMAVYTDGENGELYHLHTDPHEISNLFDSSEAATVQSRLMRELTLALMQAEDPLPIRTADF